MTENEVKEVGVGEVDKVRSSRSINTREGMGYSVKMVEGVNIAYGLKVTKNLRLSAKERAEIKSVFPMKRIRVVGRLVYKLKLMGYGMYEIIKILGCSKEQYKKISGLIDLNKFLVNKILISTGAIKEDINSENIDLLNEKDFKLIIKKAIKKKLIDMLNRVNSVTLRDASLEEIANAYKKLLSIYKELKDVEDETEINKTEINNISDEELKELAEKIKEMERIERGNNE